MKQPPFPAFIPSWFRRGAHGAGWLALMLLTVSYTHTGPRNGHGPKHPRACTPTDTIINLNRCAGDTVYAAGKPYTQTGFYKDTITNAGGCDSFVYLSLHIDTPVAVTLSWDSLMLENYVFLGITPGLDSFSYFCLTNLPRSGFAMTGGSPPGGTYTGMGIVHNYFYPDSVHNPNGYLCDTITYTVTDEIGCPLTDTDTIGYAICTGIEPVNGDNTFSVFPNPATDKIYIKTTGIQPRCIIIYDDDGHIITATPFKPEIDITGLSTGSYFIELQTKDAVIRKVFVKM